MKEHAASPGIPPKRKPRVGCHITDLGYQMGSREISAPITKIGNIAP